MRRWSFEHVTALVQLLCGLGLLCYGLVAWSGPALIGFTVVVSAAFVVWAWRTWRRAERTPPAPAPRSAPVPDPAPMPAPIPVPPIPVPEPTPIEPLSEDEERELARVVAALAAEGVFAPRVPDPRNLSEAAADAGPPITAEVVLSAVEEAGYHHPGFRTDEHTANVALHHSHAEQFVDTLDEQAADLVRLADGGLDDVRVTVEQDERRTRLRIATADDERVVEYAHQVKALSTVLHVTLATILRERRTGRRLGSVWSDAGVWVSGLTDGGVDRLNTALADAAGEGWEWLDEQEPHAAGDLL